MCYGRMNLFILLLIFLVVIASQQDLVQANYGDECVTPTNVAGQCVPILSCSPIVKTFTTFGVNIPDADKNIIRQSFCGVFDGENHVCCPKEDITLNSKVLEKLQQLQCGYFDLPRVSNGKEAILFTFPWMALLKYDDDTNPFKCGGTLINERYVLTAAHCVVGIRSPLNEVRLGEHNISSVEDCQLFGRKLVCAPPVEDIGIEQIIPHPGYTRSKLKADIALLRLNRPVEFKRHIKPICLPITPQLMSLTLDTYFVSGWGYTEKGSTSDVLMYANLPHQDHDFCREAFKYIDISESQLCVGGNNMQDSCQGDSGGPITQAAFFNNKLKMVQFGIVSYGVRTCGEKSLPAVYTNVPYYMQWITDVIRP